MEDVRLDVVCDEKLENLTGLQLKWIEVDSSRLELRRMIVKKVTL